VLACASFIIALDVLGKLRAAATENRIVFRGQDEIQRLAFPGGNAGKTHARENETTREKSSHRLFLARPEQPPIFFHQLDVIGREAGSDIDFAVGDTPVDLEFGHGPAVNENEKGTSTPLDAERIESQPAVLGQ